METLDKILAIIEKTQIPESINFLGHSVRETTDKMKLFLTTLKDGIENSDNQDQALRSIDAFSLSIQKLARDIDFSEKSQLYIREIFQMVKNYRGFRDLVELNRQLVNDVRELKIYKTE